MRIYNLYVYIICMYTYIHIICMCTYMYVQFLSIYISVDMYRLYVYTYTYRLYAIDMYTYRLYVYVYVCSMYMYAHIYGYVSPRICAYVTSNNIRIKLYVSFAEHRLFHRALLQKRPILLRSLPMCIWHIRPRMEK